MSKTLTAEAVHLSRNFYTFPCVKAIQKEFGFKGAFLIVTILFEVTSEGFERPYDSRFLHKVASRHDGITPNLVGMVVRRMAKNDLLDKEAFTQRRMVAIPSKFILSGDGVIDSESIPYFFDIPKKQIVSSEETVVNSEETRIISEETTNNDCLLLNNTCYGTTKEARS